MEVNLPGWKFVRVIGSGGFGKVYEIAKDDEYGDLNHSALKVISIPASETEYNAYKDEGYDDVSISALFKSQADDIAREFRLMSLLKGHSNIVSYEDHEVIPKQSGFGWDILIRMELLTSLPDYINKSPEIVNDETITKLGIDICHALELCQKKNIIHRDIKPQNIFINNNGDFKLGDFGIAKLSDHTTKATKAGTYAYMAPEVYKAMPYNNSVDVYSLGMVMYWALNERRGPFIPLPPEPPKASYISEAQEKRFAGEQLPPPAHGSDQLKAAILKACAYNSSDRFESAADMKSALDLLPKVESIIIRSKPNKVEYIIDEQIDLEGLTLDVKYDNGKTRTISSGFVINPTKVITIGKQEIVITYAGKDTAFVVNVTALSVDSIYIKTYPTKVTYYNIRNSIDTSGLTLAVVYSNGTDRTINSGFTIDKDVLDYIGKHSIKVSYQGKSTNFEVVVEGTINIYKELKIKKEPQKTEYYVNEKIDLYGLELVIVDTDQKSEIVNSGYEVEYDFGNPGKKQVIIKYKGKTAKYTVNVKELNVVKIGINSELIKKVYTVGEKIDTSGLSLLVEYSNGKNEVIKEGFEVEGKIEKPGKTDIVIKYADKQVIYPITVKSEKRNKKILLLIPAFAAVAAVVVLLIIFGKKDPGNNTNTEITDAGTTQEAYIDLTVEELTITFGAEERIGAIVPENVNEDEIIWTSSDESIVVVDSRGICTAVGTGTATVTASVGNVSKSAEVSVTSAAVIDLSITKPADKQKYYVGDSLDTTGLELSVKWDNDKTETVTSGFNVSYNFQTSGTKTVGISYAGKTVEFDVIVDNLEVTTVNIASQPLKTTYYINDTVILDGLKLLVKYNSGKEETIESNDSNIEAVYDFGTSGTKNVTLTYLNKTVTYSVNVTNVEISSVSIKNMPNKTSYYVGDTIDSSGLSLTVTYNNGRTETITSGYTIGQPTVNAAGTQKITVNYGGKTTSYDVSVKELEVISISIKTEPSKIYYYIRETLETRGLSIEVEYNNGKKETVTSGFTTDITTLSYKGRQKVSVSYGGKTADFNVNVEDITLYRVSINTNPSKMTYYAGESLNTAGLTLLLTYSNAATAIVNSGFTVNQTTLSNAGPQNITVTYEGLSVNFNVDVVSVVVNSITVKTNPSKTSYYVGETLNTSGLTLTATYNNGKTETISSGFTVNQTTLSNAGLQNITVTYEGFTDNFNVNVVIVEPISITVKTNPSKTSYYVGETLNTSGLSLTVTYNNGKTETISSGFTTNSTTLNTAGTQNITVTYGGKNTTFSVSVTAVGVSSISVKTNPTKTSYYIGDSLNTSGLSLTVTYNNGKTETISSGFTTNVTSLGSAGTQTITVTYSGKTASFSVSVATPSLTITSGAIGSSTISLSASTTPSGQTVSWSSSNTGIVSINSSGTATAKTNGSVTITGSFVYQGKTYSATKPLTVGATANYSTWTDVGWTRIQPTAGDLLKITDTKTVTDQAAYIQYNLFCYDVVGRPDGINRTYRLDVAQGGTSYTYRETTANASECTVESRWIWLGVRYDGISYNSQLWYRNINIEIQVPAVTHTEWRYSTRTVSYTYKFQ